MARQSVLFHTKYAPTFDQVMYSSVDTGAVISLLSRGFIIKKDSPLPDTLAFSSELHAIHFRSVFCRAGSRPPKTAAGFEKFIVNVVKRLNSKALATSLSRGVDGHVLERHYQVEFYRRVAYLVTMPRFVVSCHFFDPFCALRLIQGRAHRAGRVFEHLSRLWMCLWLARLPRLLRLGLGVGLRAVEGWH